MIDGSLDVTATRRPSFIIRHFPAVAVLLILVLIAVVGAYFNAHDPLRHSTHVLQKDGPKLGPDGVPACDLLTKPQVSKILGRTMQQYPTTEPIRSSYSKLFCTYVNGPNDSAFADDAVTLDVITQVEPDAKTHPAFTQGLSFLQQTPNQVALPLTSAQLKQLNGTSQAYFTAVGDTHNGALGIIFTTPDRLTVQMWEAPGNQNDLMQAATAALHNMQ